jgi:serine O-acetyltransferase
MLSASLADDMTFSELVFSDLQRYRPGERGWIRVLARCLVLPGMIASVILRAQQCLRRSGHERSSNLLRVVGNVLVGADLTPGATIGPGLVLYTPLGVCIGSGATIGKNVSFASGVVLAARYPDDREQEYATICDDALIGAHAVLVGAVRIGQNAMVGSNSVVMTDVPDNAIVFGSPARVVGSRDASEANGASATDTPEQSEAV